MNEEVLLQCIKIYKEFDDDIRSTFLPSRIAMKYIIEATRRMIDEVKQIMKNAEMSEEEISKMLNVLLEINSIYRDSTHS